MSTRTLFVDARRLERWSAGFGDRHGAVTASWEAAGGAVLLSAADGSTARFFAPFPPWTPDPGSDPVASLALHAQAPRRVPVLLIRRGGYAVALVESGAVTASKVGNRYVQSRTAAGGWSQQRFARRREGQAAALLDSAAEQAVRVLAPLGGDAVVTGGDRQLADRLLADSRLRRLAALPHARHLDVGDPRSDDVKALPARLREVRLLLDEA